MGHSPPAPRIAKLSSEIKLTVSKLSASLLVIASLFMMSALGLVMLTVVADVSHLVFTTGSQGMTP